MSIWQEVQERPKRIERERMWKPVWVLGVDGAYVRGWGKMQPVLVAVDMGTGEPVTMGYVDEKDPQAVKRFLRPLMQRLGVSIIVTNDLSNCKQEAEGLQLDHRICQFHVRRWVGQAVHELKETLPSEWIEAAEEARQILNDLPIEGDKRLVALSRKFPPRQGVRAGQEWSPVDKLRSLIVRPAEN